VGAEPSLQQDGDLALLGEGLEKLGSLVRAGNVEIVHPDDHVTAVQAYSSQDVTSGTSIEILVYKEIKS